MVLDPEVARRDDALALLALREDAARWMQISCIRQWAPGEIPLEDIADQAARGEWLVLRRDDLITAAVRVLKADEATWGPRPPEALYVHGLVVHRRFVGKALGRDLLESVERRASNARREYVRLDCVESNLALRRYYRAAGYREVGRWDFSSPWLPVTLFEKHLRSD